MKHLRSLTTPHPVCSNVLHTTEYNSIWAGHIALRSDYNNQIFTEVQSEWVQRSVPANSHYNDYTVAPTASFWTGLGVTNLLQAGCDSEATATVQYHCWTEDAPGPSTYEGPAVSGGQKVYVDVTYEGNNQTQYYIENVSTGRAQSFVNASPYVGEDAANFIVERGPAGGYGLYLPDFGSSQFTQNIFWHYTVSHQLAAGLNIAEEMTSNCQSTGTELANPGSVNSSGDFTVTWKAASPYSDTCKNQLP